MKSSNVFTSLVLCLWVPFSFAGTVNQSNVTAFQDGTPAVAGQVNTNFQALISAINDNASRIAALESASGAVSSSMAGTYDLVEVTIDVESNDANNYAVTGKSMSGTIVLNENGSGTFNITEYRRQVGFNLISQSVRNSADSGSTSVTSTGIQLMDTTESDSGALTWTLSNGILTATTFDGTVLTYFVAGNNILIDGINNNEGQNGLNILIRR